MAGAAFLLVASYAVTGSRAGWNVSDADPGNSFGTSTILLQDNQGDQAGTATSTGSAIFAVTNVSPGSAANTGCIGVNFTGAAASGMTLTAALGGGGAATLQSQLTMNAAAYNTSGTVAVTPGTDTNDGGCTGYPGGGTNTTIGTQGATLQAWAAASPYAIASPVTNTWYEFTVSGLPAADTACATYCSKTITITFTWSLTTV